MIWQKKFIENLEPEDYKLHSTKKLSIIIIHFVASVILDFTLLLIILFSLLNKCRYRNANSLFLISIHPLTSISFSTKICH